MSAPPLRCRALDVAIGGKQICRDLNLDVAPGQGWAILGLNGAGKTTLLHVLGGLRRPSGGSLEVAGRPIQEWSGKALARTRGLLAQDTSDPVPLTVLEAALAGRYPHQSGWARDTAQDLALAREALARVGLYDLQGRDCATLSGGERRRVAAAALLVQQPLLYLLDEPTNHLDPHHQIALLDLLAQERRRGATVLMTLHDPNLAARFASHVLLLYGAGESSHGPTAAVLTEANLSRLYSHPMRMGSVEGARCFLPA
jgi:iron complex transport system ATP-binding protein